MLAFLYHIEDLCHLFGRLLVAGGALDYSLVLLAEQHAIILVSDLVGFCTHLVFFPQVSRKVLPHVTNDLHDLHVVKVRIALLSPLPIVFYEEGVSAYWFAKALT